MLLAITNRTADATDLGYLLHKNPANLHQVSLPFGEATVFYPAATPEECTAVLLVEVDPVALVRSRGARQSGWALGQYVNDRPYAASETRRSGPPTASTSLWPNSNPTPSTNAIWPNSSIRSSRTWSSTTAGYARLLRTARPITGGLTPFPRGVFHFKTHEEADEWTKHHILLAVRDAFGASIR